MAGKGKLKGLHLPLRAYIMYLLLICFALTGVTFSKYVTSTCGGDSARVAKIGSVTVTENGEPYNSDVIWRVARSRYNQKRGHKLFGQRACLLCVFRDRGYRL